MLPPALLLCVPVNLALATQPPLPFLATSVVMPRPCEYDTSSEEDADDVEMVDSDDLDSDGELRCVFDAMALFTAFFVILMSIVE